MKTNRAGQSASAMGVGVVMTDPIITVEHEVPPLCSRCKGASNELYYCRDCYRKWLQAYWRTEGPRLDIQDEDENAIFE